MTNGMDVRGMCASINMKYRSVRNCSWCGTSENGVERSGITNMVSVVVVKVTVETAAKVLLICKRDGKKCASCGKTIAVVRKHYLWRV